MLIKCVNEYNNLREAKEHMEMRKMSGTGTISSCLNLGYENYLLHETRRPLAQGVRYC
jgi:hypothetical protein